MAWRRPGWRLLLVIFVGLTALVPSSLASIAAGHAGIGSSPQQVRGLDVPVLPSTAEAAVGHQSPLIVNSTLILANGTLLPGNVTPNAGSTPPSAVIPTVLTYDSGTNDIFSAGAGRYNVQVISPATDEVLTSINVTNTSLGLVYDSGTSQVFVSNTYCSWSFYGYCITHASDVLVINDSSRQVAAAIPVDNTPQGMAYDPARGEVFVALGPDGKIAVINDTLDSVVANVSVGTLPCAIAYDSATGDLFVANNGSNNVSVLSTSNNTVIATVPVGTGPQAIAYDSGRGEIFVGNVGSNDTSVISGSNDSILASITLAGQPNGIAYDPARGQIFVTLTNNTYWGNISVISDLSNQVVANVTTWDPMGDIVYDPSESELFALDMYNGTLAVIADEADVVQSTIWFTTFPGFVAYDPAKAELFVTDQNFGGVLVLSASAHQVVRRIYTGDATGGIVYDPGTGQVFVANQYSDSVTVINDSTDQIVGSVSLPNGSSPYAITYDSGRGEIFVADYDGNNVSVIADSSDEVVATVSVGSEPIDIAYDPTNGDVFVANSNSSYVSVISDLTNRVGPSIRLPKDSSPTNVVYDAGKGEVFIYDSDFFASHNFIDVVSGPANRIVSEVPLPSVMNPGSLLYDPADHSVLLSDTSTEWNGIVVVSDQTDRVTQWLPTEGAEVGTTGFGPAGMAFDSRTETVYAANPWEGTLSLVTPSTLTFVARGLSYDTAWSIVGGSPQSNESNTTTAATGEVSFLAPLGLFQFNVSVWGGGYGVVKVSGPGVLNQTALDLTGAATVVITFATIGYLVFNESGATSAWPGLAPGTLWGVTITPALTTGPPAQSETTVAGSEIVFQVPVGATYHFQVSKPAIYQATPSRGTVSLKNWLYNTTKLIKFRLVTAPVLFRATGLPLGTEWQVNVTGPLNVSLRSNTSTIRFLLVNGTYNFTAWNFSEVHPHPLTGSFVVAAPHPSPIQRVLYGDRAVPRAMVGTPFSADPGPAALLGSRDPPDLGTTASSTS
jgi:YVTN family beta-propeller protein